MTLAEKGNLAPLCTLLQTSPLVNATAAGNGLLDPGKSISFQIQGNPRRDRLSLAAMLIRTNDAFVSLDSVQQPYPGWPAQSYSARVHVAGGEVNDELCTSIPGPFFAECNGSGGGGKVNGGEGFVPVRRGIHGVGNLKVSDRDWRNPVAEVRVRPVR